MKQEDLIKKLENIKTPDIEIQSHQRRLRLALLNSGYFKEKPIMFYTKRLVPVGVALALILVVGFTVINPKLQIARAMEIAQNDPHIQQLMEDYGVEIKEVKLHDGKAYVLLALPEEKLPSELEKRALGGEETLVRGPGQMFMAYQNPETGEVVEFSGSIVEISLKEKRIEKLEMVETMKFNLAPLTGEERDRVIEIAKTERKIKEMIPDLEEREIIVKPLPPLKLHLVETTDGMRTESEEEVKRVNVIFKSDDYQDTITVNLTTGKVEGAMSYSTGSKIKNNPCAVCIDGCDTCPEGCEECLMGIWKKEMDPNMKWYYNPEHLYPIKPKLYLEPDGIETSLPDEGVVIMESGTNEGLTANQKEIFAQMLKDIAEKDDRIKDLLKDNDYEILEIIRSKPITTKTETSIETRVETATVVLEKESTNQEYWITIDLGTNTIKSIKEAVPTP